VPPGGDHGADFLSLEEAVRGAGEIDQVRQLKQLQEENGKLKKLVAELSLDKAMLQDVPSKKF
jgi:putative transposase